MGTEDLRNGDLAQQQAGTNEKDTSLDITEKQQATAPSPRLCPKCGREVIFYEGHDWHRCPAPCNAWHRFYHCLECEDIGFRYIIKFHQERGEPFLFACECDCRPPRPSNRTLISSRGDTWGNNPREARIRVPLRFADAPSECKFLAEYKQYLEANPTDWLSHSHWLALIHYPLLHERWYQKAYKGEKTKKIDHGAGALIRNNLVSREGDEGDDCPF